MLKRIYDIVFAAAGLLLVWPLLLLIAIAIKVTSHGPIFFRQKRIGLNGRPFMIVKFRSMTPGAEKGANITKGGDARVTNLGRLLRKTKLDELPQLWNVLCGQMSFVGPRPEVPEYVARYNSQQKGVLCLKPGITDLATLFYRNEEELLQSIVNFEQVYAQEIMPRKIELSLAYAKEASLWQDTKIIFHTLIPWLRMRTPPDKDLILRQPWVPGPDNKARENVAVNFRASVSVES